MKASDISALSGFRMIFIWSISTFHLTMCIINFNENLVRSLVATQLVAW